MTKSNEQKSDEPQKTTTLDGIPDVVALDIIGHDSEAISQNYTHIDTERKRRAIDAMPDIT
jgi:hypothetical protein